MANLRTIQKVTATVQTTDATQTTCGTFTVPTNTVIGIQAIVIGKDASNNLFYGIPISAATRSGGGTSIVGSVLNLFTPIASVALATASATVDASSNDIRVRVTGVAATTIDWFVEISIWEV